MIAIRMTRSQLAYFKENDCEECHGEDPAGAGTIFWLSICSASFSESARLAGPPGQPGAQGADRTYVLKNGEITSSEVPAKCSNDSAVRETYLGKH